MNSHRGAGSSTGGHDIQSVASQAIGSNNTLLNQRSRKLK